MTEEQFAVFMKEQVEFFKQMHGDCKNLTAEEIEEDSLEFRRRWARKEDGADEPDINIK